MEEGDDKRDTYIGIATFKLPDEFSHGRILEDCRGDIKIVGNVLEGKMVLEDPRAEDPLKARHLPVEKFVPYGDPVPKLWTDRAANTCQEESARK